MPELPEVQTIVSQISPLLREAVLESVIVHRAGVIRHGRKGFTQRLAGRTIRQIDREAKRIVVRLRPQGELVFHLGMSGRLTIEPPAAPVVKHTHIRIRFGNRPEELRFRDPRRFGGVWFFDEAEPVASTALGRVGPDALTIRVPVLREICRRRRQIKALLLDQRQIAGLGNIYTDEALFAAGLHPSTRASDLSETQVRRLACSIRKVLRLAIEYRGSTLREYRGADGAAGRFQDLHRVYGREGDPCHHCGTLVRRIQSAGRSTHFCPRCQRRIQGSRIPSPLGK